MSADAGENLSRDVPGSSGARHTVEVAADSLFEADALALAAFGQAEFVEPNPGPGSRLEIEVKHPSVNHVVTAHQVREWVEKWVVRS